MNDREHPLDDIAVYALGALPARDARRVGEHLHGCSECREEYAQLRPAATALAYSESSCASGENGAMASPQLKQRIMHEVHASKTKAARVSTAPQTGRAARTLLWPAYLIAAACLAMAIISTISSISLTSRLRLAQTQTSELRQSNTGLSRNLAEQRTMVADLMSADAKHYAMANGAVITRGGHLYVTLRDLPRPPKGKVYQAWTLAKGAKAVAPSSTFVPDAQGEAVVALPQDARTIAAVAVSVEPNGGSRAPTTKPIAFVSTD